MLDLISFLINQYFHGVMTPMAAINLTRAKLTGWENSECSSWGDRATERYITQGLAVSLRDCSSFHSNILLSNGCFRSRVRFLQSLRHPTAKDQKLPRTLCCPRHTLAEIKIRGLCSSVRSMWNEAALSPPYKKRRVFFPLPFVAKLLSYSTFQLLWMVPWYSSTRTAWCVSLYVSTTAEMLGHMATLL